MAYFFCVFFRPSLAFVVVSFLLFSFAFGVGALRGCSGFASSIFSFAFAFSYSGVSYSDHSSKLTMF